MRIQITGSRGMLGQDLVAEMSLYHEVEGLDLGDMDITKLDQVRSSVESGRPDVVIHTAAFTAVDECEHQRELAFQVNAEGTRNLALTCAEFSIPLLYVSTDYVFDGKKLEPYVEDDAPNPINAYGQSKLAGEDYVRSLLQHFWIARTSWLFGMHGKNFVRTILEKARSGHPLRVVNDQVGSPTYTKDLARAICNVIEKGAMEVYHITNQGVCTWFEFAKEILRQAGLSQIQITPISSSDLALPAQRPKNSRLANTRIKGEGMESLPHWKDALRRFMGGLVARTYGL